MNLVSVDRLTLPAAMLATAKEHLRVRHDRDDGLITQHLAMAISAVERRCNINVNPAVYALDAPALALAPLRPSTALLWPCAASPRYALPVNNVVGFTLLDADGVDQSAGYAIEQADLGGSAAAYLVGAYPLAAIGGVLTLDVGMDAPEQIDPAVAAAILRLTGGYYENRESPSAVVVDDFLGELAAVWRPCV
jgi:hypothetical protein